jgi:hypothetical protein
MSLKARTATSISVEPLSARGVARGSRPSRSAASREEADRLRQPSGEDVGEGRHGERREHEPQGDPLLPGIDAEAWLRADGDPAPVVLADADLERLDQEVLLAHAFAFNAVTQDAEDAPVGEGAAVAGDDDGVDGNGQVVGQPADDARRRAALHARRRRPAEAANLQRLALGEDGALALVDLLDLGQPVEVGRGRRQVEDQEEADHLGGHHGHAGERQELNEQRRRGPLASEDHVRRTLAVNM